MHKARGRCVEDGPSRAPVLPKRMGHAAFNHRGYVIAVRVDDVVDALYARRPRCGLLLPPDAACATAEIPDKKTSTALSAMTSGAPMLWL